MNIDHIKYEIHRHFRLQYGVTLTQAQLDDIHDFYHEARKQSLKDVIYYRFINMMLGVIASLLFFIIDESPWDSWFLLIVLALFVFYNQIHGIINWMQYKRIKTPIRPSDED